MAGRQANPTQGNRVAAGAAIVLLAAGLANPATASSNTPVPCDDVADVALVENPVHTFQATRVNYENDAKQVDDDAATPVNGEKAVETPDAKSPIAEGENVPSVNARVPGVSDDELARYKRRMYRKDI